MHSRAHRTLFGEWWWTVDRLTLAAIGALMLAGVVLSLAASPPVAGRLGLDPFYFVNRHILFLLPSIAVMLGVSFLNPQQVRRLSLLIFAVSLVLAAATPFFGPEIKGARHIGLENKQHHVPALLVVDGQQRLTSLYSVLRGKQVLDEEFRAINLEIAFRPRDGRFEVCDAAIRRDPEFIPNISALWTSDRSSFSIVNDFLKNLESRRTLTDEDREAIGHNLDRLFDLQKYSFTALEITPVVDEEAVADIFVRINSEGVKLNQADFILTLLSVFWDEGRSALETFSRQARVMPTKGSASPFNYLIQPSPDQLLRTSIALGFHRARLRSVYQLLRGKDVDSGQFSPEKRDAQFAVLKEAQAQALDSPDPREAIHQRNRGAQAALDPLSAGRSELTHEQESG